MKVLVIYRPQSEHGRTMEEFVHEFQRRYQDARLEILDIDSRAGTAMANLYDVMQYPAVLVLQDDGYLHRSWQGEEVPPLMDEVAGYARS